jgi:hypothetical protein
MPETTLDRGDDFVPTDEDTIETNETTQTVEPPVKDAQPEGEEAKAESPKTGEEAEEPKEGEEEPKEGEEEPQKERAKYIPRARFDKAQEKAKAREEALQHRIRELEQGKMTQQQSADLTALRTEIDELQDKYEDLLLDGKKAEAKALRAQIRDREEALVDFKAQTTSQAFRDQTLDQLKYESALAAAEASHPELNPDHESFDPALTDEVAELMEAYLARGYRRQAALERAVRYVVGAAKPTNEREDTRLARDRAAREKSAAANSKQPQSMAKVGIDSDRAGKSDKGPDITRMSQEQFAKLDEETLAKLRGDDF